MTPRTVAHQALLSMGFSRQEYWSGLPLPPLGISRTPGNKPASPALAGGFFTTEQPGKPFTAGQMGAETYPPTLQGSHSGKSRLQGPGALERNVGSLGPGGKQGCNKDQIKIPRLGFKLPHILVPSAKLGGEHHPVGIWKWAPCEASVRPAWPGRVQCWSP